MKALVYNGFRNVSVKDVPDAKIEQPTDVLVKITSTNIRGSDLHMYEGRTRVEHGKVLGHENLGAGPVGLMAAYSAIFKGARFDARDRGWTKVILKPGQST